MKDILHFIALKARMTSRGVETSITFTPTAIQLIKTRYALGEEELKKTLQLAIEQNKKAWEELSDEEKESITESLVDQLSCEHFIINQMNVGEYIEIAHSSKTNEEIQISILTKNELEYI